MGGFPEFDAVPFGVGDPAESTELGVADLRLDGCREQRFPNLDGTDGVRFSIP